MAADDRRSGGFRRSSAAPRVSVEDVRERTFNRPHLRWHLAEGWIDFLHTREREHFGQRQSGSRGLRLLRVAATADQGMAEPGRIDLCVLAHSHMFVRTPNDFPCCGTYRNRKRVSNEERATIRPLSSASMTTLESSSFIAMFSL